MEDNKLDKIHSLIDLHSYFFVSKNKRGDVIITMNINYLKKGYDSNAINCPIYNYHVNFKHFFINIKCLASSYKIKKDKIDFTRYFIYNTKINDIHEYIQLCDILGYNLYSPYGINPFWVIQDLKIRQAKRKEVFKIENGFNRYIIESIKVRYGQQRGNKTKRPFEVRTLQ
jgi:hypothetical protein